ncbi:putative ribonuclease H-like domain-containing protein [Tanacetum coccineum]
MTLNTSHLRIIHEDTTAGIFTHSSSDDEEQWLTFIIENSCEYLPYGKKAIRLEAIRIFLAFASYMGFIVYQMDVKSAFLYGKIDEEVYVSQPPAFLDPKYPEKVYKVVKALYGLHQAPRAWYATLSTFLLKNGYRKGKIDKTLFLKKDKHDIILVQVYVDDIIFGSTKKSWCDEFEALMKSEISDKYVAKILKKFDFVSVKTASTPIETQKPLVKDEEASDVDVHLYRSMIGSLMYVTASRPDIMYLKGKPNWALVSRESSFDVESIRLVILLVQILMEIQTGEASRSFKDKDIAIRLHLIEMLYGEEKSYRDVNSISVFNPTKETCLVMFDKKEIPVLWCGVFQVEILANISVRLDSFSCKIVYQGASSERLSDVQPSPSPTPTGEIPNESLPDSSSAQPSEVPFEQQPDPSPRPSPRPSPTPSPTPIVPDSIPEPTDQAKEIKLLKAKITKLKKQAKPVIKHHKEYLKIISLQQRFPKKSFSKKQRVHKKYVSKQGRKKAKGESSVQRDPMFEVLAEDKIDHMETENAQTEGRTRDMVDEENEFDEDRLSTKDEVSTVKEGVSTDFEKVSTDRPKVSTDEDKVSTDEQVEGTEEQREAKVLLRKENGVGLKDVEEIDRPRLSSTRSLLTLKPLPKIDPKDKGKKKIQEGEESKSEDDDIPQAVKKFKQLESDEKLARKIQEDWEAEEERNKIAEEQAYNEASLKNFE